MSEKLAFVFPGQGSQSVGMCDAWSANYPECVDFFQQASKILGYDLWSIVHTGPAELLNQTIHTQPAMLTADVIMWHAWRKKSKPLPKLLAGHSLGEYAALIAADALNFDDAIALVQKRAQLMQAAVPEGGGMAVILGLPGEQVTAICQTFNTADNVVEAVNFNSPTQVVVAGHLTAIAKVIEQAKSLGAKRAMQLPLSIPSHCQLMKTAAEKFAQHLESTPIKIPKISVIQNADTAIHRHTDDIRQALVQQLYRPVQWVDTIQTMISDGINTIGECGAGKVLTGLNKRIDTNLNLFTVEDELAS